MKTRNIKADNIRFVLIFLVVFGHFLELVSGKTADTIYRGIYSFHIPALIFISGYFARFDGKKILLSLVWPYLVLQTLYLLFQGYVIAGKEAVTLSYTTPHWLLWYLLAMIFYHMLTPMLQWEGKVARTVIFALSVGVSLLAGLDKNIGYYMTLSRFFCFLPFFVAGYYCGNGAGVRLSGKKKNHWLGLISIVVLIPLMYLILRDPTQYSRNVLYGSYAYEKEGYTWLQRGALLVTGFAWIGMLFAVIPDKKLFLCSSVGRNTLPVFLFHGFIVRLLGKHGFFHYGQVANLCLAAAVAVAVVLLLGNPVSSWLCKWGFTGHWLAALTKGKKGEKQAAS